MTNIFPKCFADVGPRRPQGSSPLLRRGDIGDMILARALDVAQDLEEVKHYLEGLTDEFSDIDLQDVPRQL